jgi:hypothetical protein
VLLKYTEQPIRPDQNFAYQAKKYRNGLNHSTAPSKYLCPMEMQTLKTFDQYFSAHVLLGRLKAEGIRCGLKDEYTVTIDPLLSNAIGGIKLQVAAEDFSAATALLLLYEEEELANSLCAKCHKLGVSLLQKPAKEGMWIHILNKIFPGYNNTTLTVYQCNHCGFETKERPVAEDN